MSDGCFGQRERAVTKPLAWFLSEPRKRAAWLLDQLFEKSEGIIGVNRRKRKLRQ